MIYDAIPQVGIPVHHRDLDGVLEAVDDFIVTSRRTGRTHQIVTVNTDFIVQARKHPDVHAILRSADIALPDGMPIVWASAALGQPLPGRIAGADLVPAIADRAARLGYRLMFFGGGEGVGRRAADVLRRKHPELIIAASTATVSEDGATDVEVLDEIRRFRPDVICVALGHPKQERWIRRHGAELGIPVAIGVGGTFDFIAGQRKRAASWIQRSGFEWLFRLAQEPGRLTRRYVTDIAVYVPSIVLQSARTRLPRRTYQSRAPREPGQVDEEIIEVIESDEDAVVVALRRHGRLDHRTAAALTSFATLTRREGRQPRLVAPDLEAIRSLEKLRLDRLITLVPHSRRDSTRPNLEPVPIRD